MTQRGTIYCLDSNCLVEAWNKYYSPDFCEGYWEVLAELGRRKVIFLPEKVQEEIFKKDDTLKKWLQKTRLPVKAIDVSVQECLKAIFAKDPNHRRLVDSSKRRSEADPWVIAHAINEKAVVVTKEDRNADVASPRVKIPNVCDAMGVRWISDFDFIRETNIKFSSELRPPPK